MKTAPIPLLIGVFAGICMALQGSFNTLLSKAIGLVEANFVVHVIGTILLIVLLFIGLGKGDLAKVGQAPWYAYLGGVFSIIILYTVMASISKLGVSIATTAIIVGQVSTALLIDHFGFFGLKTIPFTWWKLLGVVFLAAGTKLMLTN